jgi:ATP-binding cassette subfamily F protein uup
LLVSHDRTFLNNVVAGTFVFEGNGRVVEYAGGYDDWLMQRPSVEKKVPATKEEPKTAPERAKLKKPQKLGYMEKREFDALPRKIDALEKEQEELFKVVSDPLFYKTEIEAATRIKARLNEVAEEIEKAYMRWEELDNKDNARI